MRTEQLRPLGMGIPARCPSSRGTREILRDPRNTSEENSVTAPTGQSNENLGNPLTAEQIESRNRSEAIIMNQIAKCVDEEMKIKVYSKATAKEMWDCLKTHHQGKSKKRNILKEKGIVHVTFR